MSVPGFQDLMLPILQLAIDGKEHTLAESRPLLAARLGLVRQWLSAATTSPPW